jgi:pimeloyl-ACP methyl ester carboxylesterase
MRGRGEGREEGGEGRTFCSKGIAAKREILFFCFRVGGHGRSKTRNIKAKSLPCLEGSTLSQETRAGCFLASVFLLLLCPFGRAGETPTGGASPPKGLVFCADGAGGWDVCSRSVHDTIEQAGYPLEARIFRWTHGHRRVISDHLHASHMRREGEQLAQTVRACLEETPGRSISLLGHSAGCAVVLTAAEHLPPGSLDRIILLSPAVSHKHDLRPALTTVRRGIEVFYSEADWAALGLCIYLSGTTDRCWTMAAGRVGFHQAATNPDDAVLLARLHQYPWHPSMEWTGHRGGHYGSHQPGFLRAFVLPLLAP